MAASTSARSAFGGDGVRIVLRRRYPETSNAMLMGAGAAALMALLWLFGGATWWAALLAAAGAAGAGLLYDRTRTAQIAANAQNGRSGAADILSRQTASLVERFPDPILILDSQGRVLLANRASQPVAGAAGIGKHVSSVIRVPALIDALERATRTGATQEVEYAVLVPVERHYHAHIVPAAQESGREPLTLILLHDLTAMKRVEQMRADFVANASHELRTPLAALSGFIETLHGHAREDPQARDKFLGIMAEQTARMRRLIDDLLSLSRIELNEHNPPSGSVELYPLLRDVADALAPIAQRESMTISISAPPPMPPVIGDRDELMQVFQNLIDNAVKYGHPGTAVRIDLGLAPEPGKRSASGLMAFVSVRDSGEGIRREDIPRLTERFYRVDVKRSRERGGTGLGLAIVKHILNRHQGRLEIESQLGKGSTFTVRLPCVREESLSAAQ